MAVSPNFVVLYLFLAILFAAFVVAGLVSIFRKEKEETEIVLETEDESLLNSALNGLKENGIAYDAEEERREPQPSYAPQYAIQRKFIVKVALKDLETAKGLLAAVGIFG